ncbi:helix-turn-helix domain-containing protein [Aeromicrobium sp. Leaf350]|uniref:winged helix-turn-helix transcriptional regulator n=1 Tax=Aeromicrobium sp. Leaf350 TaxID=2876565 RepID=UPI001E2A5D52|nr:helix-turn-helix domain-containing protein [Aeromicrobium sp. Leaf350]
MRHDDLADVNCSVAKTWSVVGERWTMLVLRELFRGQRRFDAIQETLGLGRSVLADRLVMLTSEGVLERVQYQDSPARHEYRLTPKGEDLYPLLVALIEWGDRWKSETPPMALSHRACGHRPELQLRCPHCEEQVTRRELRATFAADAW